MNAYALLFLFAIVASCQANSLNRHPVARTNVQDEYLYNNHPSLYLPGLNPNAESIELGQRFGAYSNAMAAAHANANANAAANGYLNGHIGGQFAGHLGGQFGGYANANAQAEAHAAAAAAANSGAYGRYGYLG